MKLPLYELKINETDDAIVSEIAFVESPAIESDFLAFNSDKKKEYFISNDEKMELLGAAMIPDLKIYRKDENGNEYEVFFSKETIHEIVQIFFKKGLQHQLNIGHTEQNAKSFIYQSYIVDSSKGLNSPKDLDLPDGSWVIGVKVQDSKVWEDIKAGKQKGFSVEGLFDFVLKGEQINSNTNEDFELMILFDEIISLLK